MRVPVPLSQNQIKAVKLLGKRSERYRKGLIIVEGVRAVKQVASNGVLPMIMLILERERAENSNILNELNRIRNERGQVPVYIASNSVFQQMADTESVQGMLAVCRMPDPVDEQNLLSGHGLILATDHVQDPGNLGTMIRTSVWFGLSGLVVSPGTVDIFHPKVIRSTAGATGVLPWMEADLQQFLSNAAEAGWKIYLLDADTGSQSYKKIRPTGRDIMVVGNEANGLVSVTAGENRERMRIDPVADTGVESLNVSVAASIIMAHLAGQVSH